MSTLLSKSTLKPDEPNLSSSTPTTTLRRRFCNPASAHEKGGVEGLIGYVRRNYLVPIPEAESLEDLNDRLLQECLAYGDHRIRGREGTVNELFAGEQSWLLPLPAAPFTVIQITTGKVDSYATVIVDKNRYSVPTFYAGLKVQVQLAVTHLETFHNGKRLATHLRLFGNNKWQLNPDHYLELIQQRPEAFHGARPLRRWRETWPPCLEKLLARFQESQGETAGIPVEWVNLMKAAMKSSGPFFSARRMVKEYSRKFYQPALQSTAN